MTDQMMSLRTLLEKSSDADLLREMVGFAAQRLTAASAFSAIRRGSNRDTWLFEMPVRRVEGRRRQGPARVVAALPGALHVQCARTIRQAGTPRRRRLHRHRLRPGGCRDRPRPMAPGG